MFEELNQPTYSTNGKINQLLFTNSYREAESNEGFYDK